MSLPRLPSGVCCCCINGSTSVSSSLRPFCVLASFLCPCVPSSLRRFCVVFVSVRPVVLASFLCPSVPVVVRLEISGFPRRGLQRAGKNAALCVHHGNGAVTIGFVTGAVLLRPLLQWQFIISPANPFLKEISRITLTALLKQS